MKKDFSISRPAKKGQNKSYQGASDSDANYGGTTIKGPGPMGDPDSDPGYITQNKKDFKDTPPLRGGIRDTGRIFGIKVPFGKPKMRQLDAMKKMVGKVGARKK